MLTWSYKEYNTWKLQSAVGGWQPRTGLLCRPALCRAAPSHCSPTPVIIRIITMIIIIIMIMIIIIIIIIIIRRSSQSFLPGTY